MLDEQLLIWRRYIVVLLALKRYADAHLGQSCPTLDRPERTQQVPFQSSV